MFIDVKYDLVHTMIPKFAHVVWNHKQVLHSQHPLIINGLHNLISLNPDWQVTVYTPDDIESDLQNILISSDYDLVKNRHFVSKIDLWRLFKMYFQGGLYMDIDRMVNIPLADIFDDSVDWVIPTTREYDFSCDIMISAPGNPVFKTGFEMYVSRVRAGADHQYFLGPQTYMHAVSWNLCGRIVDTNPGVEAFEMLRDKIAALPFARTYREVPYDDMLVYRGDQGDQLEWIKRDFYAREGVRHWTGEW